MNRGTGRHRCWRSSVSPSHPSDDVAETTIGTPESSPPGDGGMREGREREGGGGIGRRRKTGMSKKQTSKTLSVFVKVAKL